MFGNQLIKTIMVKNMFDFSILLFHSFQCCWQVLQTSTDPSQQFSALFKAGNSRQVQTCYKPNSNTKETTTFSSLHRYRRNGSSHDLETLSINTTTLATCARKHFHFWRSTSSGILSYLSETMPLSHYYYFQAALPSSTSSTSSSRGWPPPPQTSPVFLASVTTTSTTKTTRATSSWRTTRSSMSRASTDSSLRPSTWRTSSPEV